MQCIKDRWKLKGLVVASALSPRPSCLVPRVFVSCLLPWTAEQAIVRHVDFQQIKCLLLGSPGFVKDDFFEFLNLEAVRREERVSWLWLLGVGCALHTAAPSYGWLVSQLARREQRMCADMYTRLRPIDFVSWSLLLFPQAWAVFPCEVPNTCGV